MQQEHPLMTFFENVPGSVRITRYSQDKKYLKSNYIATQYLSSFPKLTPKNQHIFFQPFSRKARHGRKDASYATRVLWVDIDRPNLPESFEANPSCIVKTGKGHHLYWLLDRPFIIANKQDIFQFAIALKQLAFLYRGDMATTHIAASMRLPGSYNVKQTQAKKVTWESFPHIYSRTRIDKLVRQYKARTHINTVTKNFSTKQPHAINYQDAMTECAAINYAMRSPNSISEPQWFDLLRTIAALPNSQQLAHQISCGYSSYSYEETTAKFNHASKYKPATCNSLSCLGQCIGCPWQNQIKSPAGISYHKRRPNVGNSNY